MDILQIRQILKEQYRNANNMKESSTKSEIKETKESSFFGPSESALSQRVIEQTKALMPELIDILEKKKNNNDHEKPTKATKSSSMDLKPACAKKVKDSRDYSFLLSETAEIPKISKGSSPNPSNLKSIPKADRNVIPKKSPDNKFKANPKGSQKTPGNLKPKMSSFKAKESGDNKSKASSAKSKPKSESLSVSKDSVPVTASKSLKSRSSENLVTESVQSSSAKQNLNLKQAKPRNTKVTPKKEGPCLKKEKEIKKGRVEEDLGDDENVDISSLIHEIMGRRGKRRYRDYDDDGDDRSMVSGFNDILKEERKSEKIARKEDEEERLRIEQEEKSARLRKEKQQKLMN